jgi:oxalate decarboxylase/phosphoglucose isomerase-like protein (cupin superfamily)
VAEGEFTFYVEGADGAVRRLAGGPGTVMPIPSGREHTIRNESPDPARALVVYSPGTAMEAFARAAAALAAAGRPAMADVLAIAAEHGTR